MPPTRSRTATMPPRQYQLAHPDARLSDEEEQRLIDAFEALERRRGRRRPQRREPRIRLTQRRDGLGRGGVERGQAGRAAPSSVGQP